MDLLDIHTHLLHNLHTIAEREYDTLLGCTNEMPLMMLIEIHTVNRTADFLILQYALSTVSEWDNCHAFTADGYRSCQIVHLGIANLRRYVTMSPGIQDASTVDAKQYAKTSLVCCMVHVSESIYTTLFIVVHLTQHTINHT